MKLFYRNKVGMKMNIEKNSKCYNYEKIEFNKGIFDEICDACYIIHLEDNGRLKNVKKQLYELPLCKNTIICHNKGFKKCNKELRYDKSNYDLIDAYMQIYNDAIKKEYDGIIILEDDFIYENDLFNPVHQNKIIKFIQKKKNQDFIYTFGVMPFLQTFNIINFDIFHHYVILSGGLHSVYYSKKAIQNIYEKRNKMTDIDEYLNATYFYKKYGYVLPLITQTFPETDNSKNWTLTKNIGLYSVLKPLLEYFELHKSTKNYKIFYITSIILFSLLMNISTFVLYSIVMSIVALF